MTRRSFDRLPAALATIALAILLAGHAAWGQPASDVAYEEGRRLYDLREWDQAIAKFKEAYRIRPDAKSLFNIAQALRLKGDCVEAVNFYRTYKRNFPKEKNLAKVDKFLADLEPCPKPTAVTPEPVKPEPAKPEPVKRREPVKLPEPVKPREPVKPGTASAPVSPAPDPDPVSVTEPSRSIGTTQRTSGIGIAAIGALLAAGGVYYGFQASSLARDAQDGGGVWDPGLEDRGKGAARNARLLLGAGGAAIVGGAIIYLIAPRAELRVNVGVAPRTDGAMVVWAGTL